jgi:hypothetical protein
MDPFGAIVIVPAFEPTPTVEALAELTSPALASRAAKIPVFLIHPFLSKWIPKLGIREVQGDSESNFAL